MTGFDACVSTRQVLAHPSNGEVVVGGSEAFASCNAGGEPVRICALQVVVWLGAGCWENERGEVGLCVSVLGR